MRKLPNKDLYRVFNKETGEIFSYGTTLENAKKQIRLLYMIERENMSGGSIVNNPTLYEKAKQIADKVYKKASAYKSGFIVKKYKELGGTYSDDNKPKDLKRWFREKWIDIGGENPYPVYRPTKRISKKTPLTIDEIDPKNATEQIELKQIIQDKENLPPFIPLKELVYGSGSGSCSGCYSGSGSYFKQVENALHKHYGKNVKLEESNKKDKKFMILNPATGKYVHFGQKGFLDYYLDTNPTTREKRRANFRRRNAKWANAEKWSPAHLAYYVLW